MGLITYFLISFTLYYMQGVTQGQEYTVTLTPTEAMVNKGENVKALCNIPGLSALDIISMLKVRWYHNREQLTSLCEFEDPDTMSDKYICNVLSPQAKNISLEFTVQNIQKKDTGNLTCQVWKQVKQSGKWIRDELVAKKDVVIKVREPIRTMAFKFDQSLTETLTLDNNAAPHRIEVDPGMYGPTCMVNGSTPKANVMITMGSEMMKGRMVDMPNEGGTQFVADKMEFKGNTESLIKCSSSVDGLPDSKQERTYIAVVRTIDPKFSCSNNSAIVNNKRHKVTCAVYGIEGIGCNKILWQKGNDGEKYLPGEHAGVTIECKQVNASMVESTMEILQVSADDFKTPFRVIYNDPRSKTNQYQLSIPQEYSNSALPVSTTSAVLLSLVLMALSLIL
ncbi:uncharacterized protein LOC133188380 isoform X2 [Saccostrea echinata]|uniref:uncharacterized protein LOC133188380 isoform X2 n=1 Tax=Saccostrea echinata TaxID=191078 RepID=UPI002A819C7F|nr:uncharacterized protein LOC133188380 isoform X2 [Saccostrea echinata]